MQQSSMSQKTIMLIHIYISTAVKQVCNKNFLGLFSDKKNARLAVMYFFDEKES